MNFKQHALRKLYYSLFSTKFSPVQRIRLGYIFHTEEIFSSDIFNRLIRFCIRYQQLTKKKPICTIMSGVNPQVRIGMAKNSISNQVYVERAKRLAEVSSLGYHGHFWSNLTDLENPANQMKGSHFSKQAFESQLQNDLAWFQSHEISHNGMYSAGWWFMHSEIVSSLLQNHFNFDFSFSQSKYFQCPFSAEIMKRNAIFAGEPFSITHHETKITCVQNFIGCHTTPYPQDFVRNLSKLIGKGPGVFTGVVNSHDYDLDEENTLRCIEEMFLLPQIEWFGGEDLLSGTLERSLRSLSLQST